MPVAPFFYVSDVSTYFPMIRFPVPTFVPTLAPAEKFACDGSQRSFELSSKYFLNTQSLSDPATQPISIGGAVAVDCLQSASAKLCQFFSIGFAAGERFESTFQDT
jgi:hypothetical protein